MDQIFAIRIMAEEYLRKDGKLYAAFMGVEREMIGKLFGII